MNKVQIGRQRFSEIFWGIVDEKVGDYPYEVIERIVEEQQKLRKFADYNTGSVPYDDAVELYKLVKFFNPNVIAEVGTFIGVSTMAMHWAETCTSIYTCDISNNIVDMFKGMENTVTYFPKTSSTEMFRQLAEKKINVDFMYLDGRVQEEDFQYFPKIIHDQTVFVFDDFEGVEKGVVNAMRLNGANRLLIYPREGRKTAVSIPYTMLQFVPQEAT
jgi:predicted O-methyltransferase YrrM